MGVNYNNQFLKEALDELGVKQKEFGAAVKFSLSVVKKLRAGTYNSLTQKKANQIVQYLKNKDVVNANGFTSTEFKKPQFKKTIKMEAIPMDKKTKDFFGIKKNPFHKTEIVRPDDMWINQEYENILDTIYDAAEDQNFIAIIGKVGTGKTTLQKRALKHLSLLSGVNVVHIRSMITSNMNDANLITYLLHSFEEKGGNAIAGKANDLTEKLYSIEDNQRLFIVIDDAHKIPKEGLVCLKTLLEGHENVSVVLFAQPRLLNLLSDIDVLEIDRRLEKIQIQSFKVKHKNNEDLKAYIDHKLITAGISHQIFPPHVLEEISQRVETVLDVNIICQQCMIYIASIGEKTVTTQDLWEVLSGRY